MSEAVRSSDFEPRSTIGAPRPAAFLLLALLAAGIPRSAPAVPSDDLEAAVARMTRVGSASAPSFSPDGTRIAFVANLTGLPQIWTEATAGGWPDAVTALEDPVRSMEWSPDGAWIGFTLAPGGGMNTQVYVVRPDGTGLKRLTDGGKETNQLGPFSRDGRRLTFGSNKRNGAAIDCYVHDLAAGSAELATRNEGIGGYFDLSKDGKRALLSRLLYRGSDDVYLVDLATKKETLLTPHEGPGVFSAHFAADGRTIYVSSNKDRDLIAFGRVRVRPDGTVTPIEILAERSDAELASFAVDDSGKNVALVWNVAGRRELAFLDVATSKVTPGPALPAEIASGLEFSKDGSLLALSLSGAAAPSDVWVLDMKTKALRQLTRSPHAGVDLATLVRPQLVRFPAHDGLPLSGWLYRPKEAKGSGPIVLSFHGGPEGQEVPAFRSDYQALVAQGISVLAPNVRGSSGFGKRFVNLDNGALRVDGVKDIEACVRYAVGAGVADPKRIGIMGGSYGGYMTMAGLVEYPDTFAAGANLFGVVNFKTFFAHTEPWMAAISKIEYGDPETQGDMLDRLSPLTKVDLVKAPTLVLHGANDTNVPVVEAEQVVDSLKKRGIPVEYILFPDEGHGFSKLPNRIRSTTAIVKWFAKYLQF